MKISALLAKRKNLFDIIVSGVIGMILDGICRIGCTGFAEVECAVADAAGTVAEIDEIGFMIAVKGIYIRFFARLVPSAAFAEHHVA
jgi:hypothetical protein